MIRSIFMKRTLLLLVFAAWLSGCSSTLTQAKADGAAMRAAGELGTEQPTERCDKLDSQRTTWGAVAKGAAAAAVVAGGSTIPVSSDDREAQVGLAITAGVAATTAAVAVYVEEQKTAAWVRECGTPSP